MTFLTGVQVIGNVYSVYKYMVETGTKFYTYINDSMLHWFVEDVPTNEIMSIIAIILGALLPIVALLMTAMVSKNLKLWLNKKKAQDPLPSEPIPNNKYSNIPESPSQEDEELENAEEMTRDDYDGEKSSETLNKILEEEEISSKEQDFAETPEIPEAIVDSEPQDLVKARDEFYNALDEFKEQEERAKKTEDLFKEHFNEIPEELGDEDYNLDFKEEDRSGDRPIQEVVVDSPVADVSILDIDNQPAKENASEALSPIPEEPHPLKGKVEGTEEVIDVKNTPKIRNKESVVMLLNFLLKLMTGSKMFSCLKPSSTQSIIKRVPSVCQSISFMSALVGGVINKETTAAKTATVSIISFFKKFNTFFMYSAEPSTQALKHIQAHHQYAV